MIKFWEWFWLILILSAAVLDGILTKWWPKYTLSARIWDAEGLGTKVHEWTMLRYFILIFLVWAILHLVFKWVA